MAYFPLFLNLQQQPVLVVGGGEVASRKVEALLRAGAAVMLVAPQLDAMLQRWVEEGKCDWIEDYYAPHHLDRHYVQVWATTDNAELNHQVHADAKRLGILVNVVDDPAHCDFITPAMIQRGRIQLAISSGGASPVLIRRLRSNIEAILPQNLSLLAEFAAEKRATVQATFPSIDQRRQFWENFFAHPQVNTAQCESELNALFQASLQTSKQRRAGSYCWVEYGEDIELLPMKVLPVIQRADHILHMAECSTALLDLCRRDAERHTFSHHDELAALLDKLSPSEGAERTQIVILLPQEKRESYLSLIHSVKNSLKTNHLPNTYHFQPAPLC